MTRRTILAGLAAILLISTSAVPARAAGLTETQVNRVLSLLKTFTKDEALIERVTTALRGEAPAPSFCHTFGQNLKIGDAGAEVSALQQALQRQGLTVAVTGSFDAQTAFAVKAFQEKFTAQILTPAGLTRGTGFVGAATRTQLNGLYGCPEPIPAAVVASAGAMSAGVIASTTAATIPASIATGAAGGKLDYTGDAKVDPADTQYVLEVAVGIRTCPVGKDCDLNDDGKTLASDALVLANYIGSPAKTGQFDYTNDYRLDAADATLLEQIAVGSAVCGEAKLCDVNGDGQVNSSDALLLLSYTGR